MSQIVAPWAYIWSGGRVAGLDRSFDEILEMGIVVCMDGLIDGGVVS